MDAGSGADVCSIGTKEGMVLIGMPSKARQNRNYTINRQNNASNLRILRRRAEEYLRGHGIDPEDSKLTVLQQAQLLTASLKILESAGYIDLQAFMCGDDFVEVTDKSIRGYTFRGIKNEKTKQHELYVWKEDTPDNFMRIHSSDDCEDHTALNRRVNAILKPYHNYHHSKGARSNTKKRNSNTNSALAKSTMAELVKQYPKESNLREAIARMETSPLKIDLQRLGGKMFKKSWARSLFGTRRSNLV